MAAIRELGRWSIVSRQSSPVSEGTNELLDRARHNVRRNVRKSGHEQHHLERNRIATGCERVVVAVGLVTVLAWPFPMSQREETTPTSSVDELASNVL